MKQKYNLIIGLSVAIILVLSWKVVGYSADTDKDAEEMFTNKPNETEVNDPLDYKDCSSNACCTAFNNSFNEVKNEWLYKLNEIMDQEIPASDKIDDTYESLRTFNCQAEYLCRSVEYSSYKESSTVIKNNAEGEETSTGLTSKHIGTIPGCQDPDQIKSTNLFSRNGIPYIKQCTGNTENPDMIRVNNNYKKCMEMVEFYLGCSNLEGCNSPNLAQIIIETALSNNNAEQKTSALENKMVDIINKMHSMEINTEYLKNNFTKLNQLYACFPAKCD